MTAYPSVVRETSCLYALDRNSRRQIGLEDPDNVVSSFALTITADGQTFNLDPGSTVPMEVLAAWLGAIPLGLRISMAGHKFTLYLDNFHSGLLVDGAPTHSRTFQGIGKVLLRLMRERHEVVASIITRLPPLADLKARVEAYCRERIRRILNADHLAYLSHSWDVRVVYAADPSLFDTPEKLVDYTINVLEKMPEVIAEQKSQPGQPLFVLPVIVAGKSDNTSVGAAYTELIRQSAIALGREILPIVFSQLVPVPVVVADAPRPAREDDYS